MNLVEQLREAWKTSSENSLLIKKSADRIEQLEREVLEQCRLNGMGSEREAALLGRIEQLERKLQAAEVCYKDALDRLQAYEQDATRYRFLRDEAYLVNPVAAVVWKLNNDRNESEWVNTVDGFSLDCHIDELKEQPCTDHQ